ncbi:hypothetical protein VNO80_19671 [Phaseolus coccineus]|uniref:Uncharacterized protein n=1 Tax=Phaseolus coccineus TaxID=3886 RepID=A0AAN9R007_PHACN
MGLFLDQRDFPDFVLEVGTHEGVNDLVFLDGKGGEKNWKNLDNGFRLALRTLKVRTRRNVARRRRLRWKPLQCLVEHWLRRTSRFLSCRKSRGDARYRGVNLNYAWSLLTAHESFVGLVRELLRSKLMSFTDCSA